MSFHLVLDEVGQGIDRERGPGRFQQGARVEVLLVEEAQAQVVAREAELDHRAAVARSRLVEADRAAFDARVSPNAKLSGGN